MITTTLSIPAPLRALLRAAGWHRRLLAAGLAAAAVAFGLSALAPPPPRVVEILVTARDLPAGSALTAGDTRVAGFSPALVPSGALRASSDVGGRVLTAAMRRGEPLTDLRFIGPALVASLAADHLVATPVRIADPGVVRLLHPGDLVDVLAAATSSDRDAPAAAPVVAAGVRVVTVPTADDRGVTLDDGALIVLATTPATAAMLARAAVSARLSVTIRGG